MVMELLEGIVGHDKKRGKKNVLNSTPHRPTIKICSIFSMFGSSQFPYLVLAP